MVEGVKGNAHYFKLVYFLLATDKVENQLFARLVGCNTPFLEYDACNFTEKNMKARDKRDKSVSKEGSGRVGIYTATGIRHA